MSGLRLALLEESGLVQRSDRPVTVAGVTHTPFQVRKRGLPFFDRGGRIHERAGRTTGLAGRTTFPPLAVAEPRIDRSTALEAARAATGGGPLFAPARLRLGWRTHEGKSRLAFEVVLAARAPAADWRVWIDAVTGAVLGRIDRLARVEGVGVVYEKNPRDSKQPSAQPLRELDPSGRLTGRITTVIDQFAPAAFAPDLHFEFPTGDPRFVQTSVYRGLTETGLLAERHGFPSTPPVPAFTGLIDPFTGTALNNAFYVPSIPAFGFGDGDGEVLANVGTDIDVTAHEFGHHVFEELVQPLVFSFEDPVLAMAEGVADTFSLLVGGDHRVGNSVVPGEKALRDLKKKATFPDAIGPDPHETGRVYGGASRDLVKKLGADVFGDLLIASLPFLPPDAIETDYRDAFLEGDRALTGGANADTLERVFRKRGFDELELPPEFGGDLVEGMTDSGFLADGAFHFFVFADLPPSERLAFTTTDAGTGTGDVDLFAFPVGSDEDSPFLSSAEPGSNEFVEATPSTNPPVDADEFWFVVVQDFEDGRSSAYDLTATATPAVVDDLTVGGPEVPGSITDPADEIDFFQFSASAGDRVRVQVRGTSGTIDPLVAVVSREPFDVLGVDDDSGGGPFGVDALLQGVLLPETGRYAVAVLSAVADFDPSFGAGGYAVGISLCDNAGGDFDGDGAADACDQDDDDDGFVDAEDLDPFDPTVCIDVDFDGCNDCASGTFDFFADGPDADGDSTCDVGDEDDDNDGCLDAIDPAPLTPSVDDDFDFLGLDCDNCADVPNPVQEDADEDGRGDACTACTRVAWTEPPLALPDQNPAEPHLQISGADRPGRTKVRASGVFTPEGGGPLDPAASGVQLRFADGLGVLHEVVVPGGVAPCDAKDGWQAKNGTFSYKNRSGALPPGCAAGSAGGLSSIRLTDEGGPVAFDVKLTKVTLAGPLARPLRFLQIDLVLGEPPGTGLASPAGAAGMCAEAVLRPGTPSSECRIDEKDGIVKKVRCQAP